MERFGVHLWLAPALNIHRSILCGRKFEYYSEDPVISGLFAAAITDGVQQHKGCGTTIKHFAANNQERNRYANNSIVSCQVGVKDYDNILNALEAGKLSRHQLELNGSRVLKIHLYSKSQVHRKTEV